MECNRLAELLPWYLNETLERAERDELDQHLAECESCRRELREARAAFVLFGAHLPAEALVAYVADSPDPAIPRDLVEGHLASCERCAEELTWLQESREDFEASAPDVPVPEVSDASDERVVAFPRPASRRPEQAGRLHHNQPFWQWAAVAAALTALVAGTGWITSWQSLVEGRSTLAELGLVHERELSELRRENRQLEEQVARLPATAAGASGAEELEALRRQAADLTARLERGQAEVARLERRLGRLSAPEVNVAVVDLHPREVVIRGTGPASGEVEVGPDGDSVTLILNSIHGGDGTFRLEIEDARGEVLHRLGGLRPLAGGGFTVALRLAELPAGRLTLRLYAEGGEEPLESYSFFRR